MATYKFYYSTMENPNIEEEYVSNYSIKEVDQVFKQEKGNVQSITRIDILADPDLINTDEALGYVRN